MPNAFMVHDDEGKPRVVIVSKIKGVDHVPGEPGEPAVEAADEVADDPGEPATATNPGRAPVKGHPKIEAKEAVPEKKASCVIKTDDGDIKCNMSIEQVLDRINLG